MKIANVVRRFDFKEWGGTETAVWNSVLEEKSEAHTPVILSTTALCDTEHEIVKNIDIRRFPYFYPYLFLGKTAKIALDKKGGNPFSFQLYQNLLNENFDIIHSHAMGRIAKLARKAAAKKNVPFVLSFHGGCYDVPKSEFEEMSRPLRGTFGYGRVMEKLFSLDFDLAESADGIICVGKNEYEKTRERFPNKKVALIPNGVDVKKFDRCVQADFRAQYKIPRERKLILCVSRIDYQKNQRFLVRLLKDLVDGGENAHLAVVGFATSATYLSDLKSDIVAQGLCGRATIIEGLPPDSDMLISAYKSADVFAIPSIHEPFGIVALEAWSAGTPLIASAVGGLTGFVKNGENGFLFTCDNINEAKKAYYNAIEHKEEISARALAEVKEKYSWESVTKMILNFYTEVSNALKGR